MADDADDTNGTAPRSLAGQMADCFVYAPLGLAFEARSLFPEFVEKGRNQVMVAKMLGTFAMQQGTKMGRTAVVDLGTQAVSLLPGVDFTPPPDEVDEQALHVATEGVVVADPSPDTASVPAADEEGFVAPLQAVPSPERPTTDIDVETLAIPDYDSLSALQVVPRLDGLTQPELAAVGAYEAATRGRKTILNKVAQLQSS